MDEDLEQLTRNELVAEVKKLRAGIRKLRDSTRPQFLRGCLRYREPLDAQLPNAPRVTGEFEDAARRHDPRGMTGKDQTKRISSRERRNHEETRRKDSSGHRRQ